nr:helix-turn-helix domain-containing protein [uncultured Cetobacterium sp.]
MEDIQLGIKIKKFRKEKNLTLKELASMVGTTSALLSQIEKGITNPSINTLKNISLSLEVPLYEFFLEDNNSISNCIVRKNERQTITSLTELGISYEILTPIKDSSMEFMILTLEKEATSGKKSLSHIREEVAYVLEGEVELTINENTVTLYQGDSVKINALTKHFWKNSKDKIAKIIFAIAPLSF